MSALKSIRNIFASKNKHEFQNASGNHDEHSIDFHMNHAEQSEKRTIRILLLGPGDSGKTTIVKQMRRIHETLEASDIQMMAPYIKLACIGYMKVLCTQSKELAEKHDEKTNVKAENEEIRQQMIKLKSPYELTKELGAKIATLWTDPALKETLRLRAKYQIHDNVCYFLDKVDEITAEKYKPNFEDYIRIRTRSTGFNMEKVCAPIGNFGEYTFEFTDVGGQRSERKKWMKIIVDQIQAVLYVAAISEYDMMCFEDNKTNRLVEALNLLREVAAGQFMRNKSVMIFLNKYDLFREKIKTIPITVAFDDYPKDQDPNDESQVVQFIVAKFKKCFEGVDGVQLVRPPIHIHRTSALDTGNIQKVFKSITLDLVKLNLQQCGMI